MPFFSKVFKHRDAAATSGKSNVKAEHTNGHAIVSQKPTFTATWTSKEIDLVEVEELVHACTLEMKSRAEALAAPFFLLPFRPETDVSPARAFISNFYTAGRNGSAHYTGASLRKELVLTEPAVLCSILKWCWSRMPGGVVTWTTYEGFRMGEQDSMMARNAFSTFIPLCVDSSARKNIIFDFFNLLAAVSAHGKLNGLGGRKLSRMAAWWAFSHSDDGKGFDGGYRSWAVGADASSHLFFAYLRSLEPESLDGFTGINSLPRSLQTLVAQTEYPPEVPTLMQRKTPKVVMLVHSVSSGPFGLLRRAKHFEYRDEELQAFSEYDDPVHALTEECKRVLSCIAAANQSMAARSRSGMNLAIEGLGSKPDESWSRFQDFGFADFSGEVVQKNGASRAPKGLQSAPQSRATNKGRPTTPSWADFLNSGFTDEPATEPAAAIMLLPPDKVLPPLSGTVPRTADGPADEDLEPGELASISTFDLDETFWWVWITSLANEEPSERKAVFGRCALVEAAILGGRWLVMEEQLKGASPEPEEGAYIAEKKSRFGFSRKGKSSRRRSGVQQKIPEIREAAPSVKSTATTRSRVSPDQQVKIKAAAAALSQQSKGQDQNTQRRGRHDDAASAKTNSVMTLGLTSEAGPAMKWARDFDKEVIRKQYLGDDFAGKGDSDAATGAAHNADTERSPAVPLTSQTPLPDEHVERELPPIPQQPEQFNVRSVESRNPASISPDSAVPTVVPEPTKDEAATMKAPVSLQTPEPMPAEKPPAAAATSGSPRIVHIGRKPVPTAPRLNNIHDHPAFRNKDSELAPAERAARQAWGTESRAYSPETAKKGNQSGFRKLFGKKKDDGKRNSLVSSQSNASLQPPSESNLGRKLSLLRRKTPTGPRQDSVEAMSVSSVDHTAGPVSPDLATPGSYNHQFPDGVSSVDAQDRADAEHAFSRFDQGPLTEAPAFAPRESVDSYMPTSPHDPVDIEHLDAPGAFPETPMEYATPMESVHENDGASEASLPGQDRWAQIRKNAAERATRMSEDQNSRPAQSILTERTEDDGETSGEETIEARVARIKARVAELTGNFEPSAGHHRH